MRKANFIKPKPKKQVAQPVFTESLNLHELVMALEATTAMQFLIDKIDELKGTSVYNQTVRNFAARLQESMKAVLDKSLWQEVPELEANRIAAMDQQESTLRMFHNLLTISLSMDYTHEAKHAMFWLDANSLFIKYGMPMTVGPDGVVRFLAVEVEGGEQ
ncbi:hypothetical protein BWI97_15840 [Siphonobacter sp. BAB-5405]|uniref:hypothetical protein n=1 Tax=Siphonobacter sp. BAB-5405 TaxID=1864825 RepID=UPI000C80BC47|nr:hypothetical protein [Siphonobacter sp. BAB-5405]PMD94867.1 hypothetical protein BWI97_15840 [Siphonobacter sp. BAB-5405]